MASPMHGPEGFRVKLLLTKIAHGSAPEREEPNMMRVRLKADGRLVEIMPDGSERALPPTPESLQRVAAASIAPDRAQNEHAPVDAGYARRVRAQTRLKQAEFASRIGVP